ASMPPRATTSPSDAVTPTEVPDADASPPPPPAEYAHRFSPNRAQIVANGGGNARTEQAVRSALAWLAAAQSADGRWDAARHGAGDERVVLGHDRRGAGAQADTGVSGLALLAFLGGGHTQRSGPYAANISKGLKYLGRTQAPDGALYGRAQIFAQMYCHSMATLAVCEAYAITRDRSLKPTVRAAIKYSLASQHPVDGGWRYLPGHTGDTSQLGWQLMALRSAETARIEVPAITWTRIDRFLRSVRRGSRGGLAAYRPEGRSTRTMTAEALLCRLLLAQQRASDLDDAAVNEAVASLLREPPDQRRMNLYYWYYATLALHHGNDRSPLASAAWAEWNSALTRSLLAAQRPDGSWPETSVWGGYGGRVYTTALAAMCLEVYYRYTPPPRKHSPGRPNVARRGWSAVPR
ncbi:MAG: squalene--hopene cyclase, partial [Planctomycetota bacterium]